MYLELLFHDNDFGMDICECLEKLWGYVRSNIQAYTPQERNIAEAFAFLHKKQRLEPMLKKMLVLIATGHDVEWSTRGLHDKSGDGFHKNVKPASEDIPRFEEYFEGLKVKFHDTKDFTKEWENSEHGWLDLESGDVGTF
jgi:hypothetical protein